jgi:hypothetical protein
MLGCRILVGGVGQGPVAQKTGLIRMLINGIVNRVVAAGNEVSPVGSALKSSSNPSLRERSGKWQTKRAWD